MVENNENSVHFLISAKCISDIMNLSAILFAWIFLHNCFIFHNNLIHGRFEGSFAIGMHKLLLK